MDVGDILYTTFHRCTGVLVDRGRGFQILLSTGDRMEEGGGINSPCPAHEGGVQVYIYIPPRVGHSHLAIPTPTQSLHWGKTLEDQQIYLGRGEVHGSLPSPFAPICYRSHRHITTHPPPLNCPPITHRRPGPKAFQQSTVTMRISPPVPFATRPLLGEAHFCWPSQAHTHPSSADTRASPYIGSI